MIGFTYYTYHAPYKYINWEYMNKGYRRYIWIDIYHVAGGDGEGGKESRGELETSAAGLGPGEDGVVVDDGGAVAVDGGGAVEEGEWGEGRCVRDPGLELIHGRSSKRKIGLLLPTPPKRSDPQCGRGWSEKRKEKGGEEEIGRMMTGGLEWKLEM